MSAPSTKTDATLCDDLQNGHASDLVSQSEALVRILRRLADIPTRDEVRKIVHESLSIHTESCAAARTKPPSALSKFSLSKAGMEGQGWGVAALLVLGIVLGIVAYYAIPNVAAWLAAWKGAP